MIAVSLYKNSANLFLDDDWDNILKVDTQCSPHRLVFSLMTHLILNHSCMASNSSCGVDL